MKFFHEEPAYLGVAVKKLQRYADPIREKRDVQTWSQLSFFVTGQRIATKFSEIWRDSLTRYEKKKKINQFNLDKEELEYLRLNLIYSQKCQSRKLFSTGYKVGTPEYKKCILNT